MSGCDECLVRKGVVHPEECIGCPGGQSAARQVNNDYFPELYHRTEGKRPDDDPQVIWYRSLAAKIRGVVGH